jgi:hypothetical protein
MYNGYSMSTCQVSNKATKIYTNEKQDVDGLQKCGITFEVTFVNTVRLNF